MIVIRNKKTGEMQRIPDFASLGNGRYSNDWEQYGPVLPDNAPDALILVDGAWLEDPAVVERQLTAALKAEAELRKMGFLSPGGAKKAEYAAKRAEVAFWDSLGGTVTAAVGALNLLPAAAKQAKFAYAMADAAAYGDATIQPAIERFRTGMGGASKVPAIAAAEAKTCAAIRAATTAVAKRAAAAGHTWPA